MFNELLEGNFFCDWSSHSSKSKLDSKLRSIVIILILGLLNAEDGPVPRFMWPSLNSLVFATSSKPILNAVSCHLVVSLLDLGDSWLMLEVDRKRAWSELSISGHSFELRALFTVSGLLQLSKWLVLAVLHPLLLCWIKHESCIRWN